MLDKKPNLNFLYTHHYLKKLHLLGRIKGLIYKLWTETFLRWLNLDIVIVQISCPAQLTHEKAIGC